MALPLIALTKSLRTTTPGKSRLILRSTSLCTGVASTGVLVVKGASWLTSLTSLMVAPSLEVEVRGERALQRVHRLGIDPPVVRVRNPLFEPELGRPVVVVVGVLAE